MDLLRVPAAELTHCYASASGKIVRHKPGCTIGHPRCKWRRKDAGQVVCECPSYLFPHRQGSGLCGRQIYGQWHRKASDPDRVYVTVEKSGRRERFATLKRAVEHAQIMADHTRRQVAVALGDRVVHVARPSARRLQALRDLVPLEKRAESRTLGLFSGKTKLEEGAAKGRQDWKAAAQKATRELAECRKTGRDPSRVGAMSKAELRSLPTHALIGYIIDLEKARDRGSPRSVWADQHAAASSVYKMRLALERRGR